jgi:hypothetical protein
MCPNLNCISIMMSFLTCITGFFMNFELFPIFELGGHLGWKSGSPDTILEGDNPRIISAKFGWDWLSSMYYRIFYELWTFSDFDRLCKLEKRGMKFKKNLLLWNYWANLNNMPNLHNQHKSAERKISKKNPRTYAKLLLAM